MIGMDGLKGVEAFLYSFGIGWDCFFIACNLDYMVLGMVLFDTVLCLKDFVNFSDDFEDRVSAGRALKDGHEIA